jgi:hypothetical protein
MIEDEITIMFDDELDKFIEEHERLADLARRERVRRRLMKKEEH